MSDSRNYKTQWERHCLTKEWSWSSKGSEMWDQDSDPGFRAHGSPIRKRRLMALNCKCKQRKHHVEFWIFLCVKRTDFLTPHDFRILANLHSHITYQVRCSNSALLSDVCCSFMGIAFTSLTCLVDSVINRCRSSKINSFWATSTWLNGLQNKEV